MVEANSGATPSRIQEFYNNQSVLIVGATSFVGRTLVGKLLQLCPNIDNIYLLIREKNDKSCQERFKEFKNSRLFSYMRPDGNALLDSKLKLVPGDITQPLFKISQEQLDELIQNIIVVFNCTGSKLMQPLDDAVKDNVLPVTNLVDLCSKFINLKSVVYLSSAYSNCHKKDVISELVYEPPMKGCDIMHTMKTLKRGHELVYDCAFKDPIDDYRINNPINLIGNQKVEKVGQQSEACEQQPFKKMIPLLFIPKVTDLLTEFRYILMKKSRRPNTYTLTKAIAESYLVEEMCKHNLGNNQDKVSVAIVRPSIVGCALSYPCAGYIDVSNGLTSLMISAFVGQVQTMAGDVNKHIDIIPVDMLADFLICCGWFLANFKSIDFPSKPQSTNNLENLYVFNVVSNKHNKLKWKTLVSELNKLAYEYPTRQTVRLPSLLFVNRKWLLSLFEFLDLAIISRLSKVADVVTKIYMETSGPQAIIKSKHLLDSDQIKIMKDELSPFTTHEWTYDDTNTQSLLGLVTIAKEKYMLNFDTSKIEWNSYLKDYILNSRTLLLDETCSGSAEAKSMMRV